MHLETNTEWLDDDRAGRKLTGVAQSTIRKWSEQGRVPAFTRQGKPPYRPHDSEVVPDVQARGTLERRYASCCSSTTPRRCASCAQGESRVRGYPRGEAGGRDRRPRGRSIEEAKPDPISST